MSSRAYYNLLKPIIYGQTEGCRRVGRKQSPWLRNTKKWRTESCCSRWLTSFNLTGTTEEEVVINFNSTIFFVCYFIGFSSRVSEFFHRIKAVIWLEVVIIIKDMWLNWVLTVFICIWSSNNRLFVLLYIIKIAIVKKIGISVNLKLAITRILWLKNKIISCAGASRCILQTTD